MGRRSIGDVSETEAAAAIGEVGGGDAGGGSGVNVSRLSIALNDCFISVLTDNVSQQLQEDDNGFSAAGIESHGRV
jgi:hypothetical protein